MKKIFLCLAILALLGSNLAFARGGGGHGGGGRGHGGGHRGGGRGGHHGGYRHYHGGRWYGYNNGFYFYSGFWYPWWYWPYRSETDVVIWQETAPEDKVINESKLRDLEYKSDKLKQQQKDLDERMKALEK